MASEPTALDAQIPTTPLILAFYTATTVIPSILYGVNSILVVMSSIHLRRARREHAVQKQNSIMLGYISILHALCTTHWLASCIQGVGYLSTVSEMGLVKPWNKTVVHLITASHVVLTLLTDGLLLWRCWVLYAQCRGIVRWMTRILFLVLSASLLGFGVTLIMSRTIYITNPISGGHPVSVLATQIIFTWLIVGRLIYHKRRSKEFLGDRTTSRYTTVAAMLVESASLNIVFQLLAVIFAFQGPNPPNTNVINLIFNVNLLGQTQVLATFLIIYRVAQGKAWSHQTSQEVSTQIRFSSSPRRPAEGENFAPGVVTHDSRTVGPRDVGGEGMTYFSDSSVVVLEIGSTPP